MEVLPVSEARAGLTRLLVDFRTAPDAPVVIIGAHRKPEAALVPILRYRELLDAQPQNVVTLDRLRKLKPVIERLAGAAGLDDVRVYGSVARGEAGPDSDVDLLVTPGRGVTLFDLAQFEMDMEALLDVPVSAMSRRALDEKRDAAILAEAVPL